MFRAYIARVSYDCMSFHNLQLLYIVGNFGNTIDGHVIRDPTEETEQIDDRFVHSLTQPCKAISADRQYYHLPYDDVKPCLHIKFNWQDHRRRLYLSNMLYKILETLVRIYLLNVNLFNTKGSSCLNT